MHNLNLLPRATLTERSSACGAPAQGYSAAALANLMNEAAIMTVRKSVQTISLPMVLDIIENLNFGPTSPKIPPSEAKNRLAIVTAAKAVAFALTPGVDVIKFATLWSRKRGQGPYVEFIKSEDNLDVDWHPEVSGNAGRVCGSCRQ